jgi:hypothetical protein
MRITMFAAVLLLVGATAAEARQTAPGDEDAGVSVDLRIRDGTEEGQESRLRSRSAAAAAHPDPSHGRQIRWRSHTGRSVHGNHPRSALDRLGVPRQSSVHVNRKPAVRSTKLHDGDIIVITPDTITGEALRFGHLDMHGYRQAMSAEDYEFFRHFVGADRLGLTDADMAKLKSF